MVSRDLERPETEPTGLSAWLGFHAELTGMAVPQAGTDRRAEIARRYEAAIAKGYTDEQLRDASRAQAMMLLPEGAFAFLPAL